MKIEATSLSGVFTVDISPISDNRGFFARTMCSRSFSEFNMRSDFVQCSVSFNIKAHTLRGMHYQKSPAEEVKLVRCISGAVWDVVLDLRVGSETFGKWCAVPLSVQNRRALYIPKGCAHGFITLEDNTELYYHITPEYDEKCSCGIRWNDPLFNIAWPHEPKVISTRDNSYQDYKV